jgi:hypothetical protein
VAGGFEAYHHSSKQIMMFTKNNREVVECRRKFGLRAVFAVSDGPVDSDDETLEYSKVGRYSMLEEDPLPPEQPPESMRCRVASRENPRSRFDLTGFP